MLFSPIGSELYNLKYCTAENFFDGDRIRNSMCNLGDLYLRLYNSLPMGEKSTIALENLELCEKKVLELKSCKDGSIGYIKGSQRIKPYFKNNTELCI